MSTDMNNKLRGEMRDAARACLARAAGQRGNTEIKIRLETVDDQPCNAATYFEFAWSVTKDGRLSMQLLIDGLRFWEGIT